MKPKPTTHSTSSVQASIQGKSAAKIEAKVKVSSKSQAQGGAVGKGWEEKLRNIEVTIVSPDGDRAWVESISEIQEYQQIRDLFSLERSQQRKQIIEEVVEVLNRYKCDFNWNFKKSKAKHKVYIELSEVLSQLEGEKLTNA
mgnify:CR=1 FL=1